MEPHPQHPAAPSASSVTLFCRGCGKKLHASATACPQCGAVQHIALSTLNATASEKSKVTAGALALLLGGIGIHKFYTGAWGWGIVYIALCWTYIPAIVALVEGIRYLTQTDAEFQRKATLVDGPFAFLW